MRSTEHHKLYNGTEMKFFMDYVGPVLVKNLLKDKHYNNFVMLHAANRLLSSPNASENVSEARAFYKNFYRQCPQLYGDEFVTLNIHAIDHIADYVEYRGLNFNKIGAWPYETHLYDFKLSVTNPHNVLAQYCRRLHSEIETLDHVPKFLHETEVLKKGRGNAILKFSYKNRIFTTKHPNNTAFLRTSRGLDVVNIQGISEEDNIVYATVKSYKVIGSAFEVRQNVEQNLNNLQFDSRSMQYVEIREDQLAVSRKIPFDRIQQKMIKFSINLSEISCKQTFVVPLIH